MEMLVNVLFKSSNMYVYNNISRYRKLALGSSKFDTQFIHSQDTSKCRNTHNAITLYILHNNYMTLIDETIFYRCFIHLTTFVKISICTNIRGPTLKKQHSVHEWWNSITTNETERERITLRCKTNKSVFGSASFPYNQKDEREDEGGIIDVQIRSYLFNLRPRALKRDFHFKSTACSRYYIAGEGGV